MNFRSPERLTFLASGLGIFLMAPSSRAAESLPYPKVEPRAPVVVVEDSRATEAFKPKPQIVRGMVERAITNLTEKKSLREAWSSVVSPQDIVGIKVFSSPGPNSGTRTAVVAPLIEGLLSTGLRADHIIIWDRQITDLRLAGFSDLANRYKVRLAAAAQEGFDEKVFYDKPIVGNLVWGDLEFGRKEEGVGRKSFVTKLLTHQVTKIINVTPMLNHNLAGVCGNLYGLAMGSVDNILRFESDPERMAEAVPEIYAMTNLSDHVVLNVVDALICQYEGGERGLLHYSAALNQVRMSRDPVALDVLSIKELERQRRLAQAPEVKPNLELYNIATLLQLGESDTNRIKIDLVTSSPSVSTNSSAVTERLSFGSAGASF